MKRFIPLLFLLPGLAFGQAVHTSQYGVAATFDFILFNTDGTLDVDEADGGAEVSVACDEGAETTATNDFVDEGTFYSISLTAAEMECARVAVVIAATDTNVFFVDTWGDTEAAIKNGVASGTAQSVTASTLVMDASEGFADDELNNSILCVTGATTGKGQCRLVSDTTGSTDTLTVSSNWTTTPTGTIEYVVIHANQATLADVGSYLDDTQGFVDLTELQSELSNLADSGDVNTITGQISDLVDGTTPVYAAGMTIQTGTCDSGSVSTCVDSALDQSDAGYWAQGVAITFTSGTISGQTRCITAFAPATDTASFMPPTTQAVSTNTYTLIAAPTCRNYP